jgi:hypothetical protein
MNVYRQGYTVIQDTLSTTKHPKENYPEKT